MAKCITVVILVAALSTISVPQVSAQGEQRAAALGRALQKFFGLLCEADPGFVFLVGHTTAFGGLRLTAEFDNPTGFQSTDGDDIRGLNITVHHGVSSSNHTVLYEDNDDSGTLTCADTAGAVM